METIRQFNSENYFKISYDDGWKFTSRKSKKVYTWRDFVDRDNESYQIKKYIKYLENTEKYEMFSIFHVYWLNNMIMQYALNYSNSKKQEFISANKYDTKNLRKADQEAEKAFNEYYDRVASC